ncbi:type VI immunity family protein [Acinetobacter sp. ESBL14]|uniref:type VI immunity family protein n=1 Tax=Acinetobacter sp. ESBL14 TaxID=3077329 RepID=UPI002FC87E2D
MKNLNRLETYQEVKRNELALYDFDQDHCVVRPCLSITLFFKHGARPYVREGLLNILEQYLNVYGDYIIGGRAGEQRYAKKNKLGINKIKNYLLNHPANERYVDIELASAKTGFDAPEYRFSVLTCGEITEEYKDSYGQIYPKGHDSGVLSAMKMVFSIDLLADMGKFQQYQDLLNYACHQLPIRGGYAGLSLALPDDRFRYMAQEYQIARQFSGLDIDSNWYSYQDDYIVLSTKGSPPNQEFYPYQYITDGQIEDIGYIKSVNWINIFPKQFFERIGDYHKILQKLQRSDINVMDLGDCVLIQAGEVPQLGSQEQGLPESYVFINKVLKYIRNPEPDSLQPNLGRIENANCNNTKLWLKRFDLEDEFEITEELEQPETQDHIVKVKGGEVCIKTGYWITPAKPDTRLYFTQGAILPILSETDWGEVYWYWNGK